MYDHDHKHSEVTISPRVLPFDLKNVKRSVAMKSIQNNITVAIPHDLSTVLFHKCMVYTHTSRVGICREDQIHHVTAAVIDLLGNRLREIKAVLLSLVS